MSQKNTKALWRQYHFLRRCQPEHWQSLAEVFRTNSSSLVVLLENMPTTLSRPSFGHIQNGCALATPSHSPGASITRNWRGQHPVAPMPGSMVVEAAVTLLHLFSSRNIKPASKQPASIQTFIYCNCLALGIFMEHPNSQPSAPLELLVCVAGTESEGATVPRLKGASPQTKTLGLTPHSPHSSFSSKTRLSLGWLSFPKHKHGEGSLEKKIPPEAVDEKTGPPIW